MRGNRFVLSMLLLAPALPASASDKALLIELEQKSGALPTGASASGAVVVGGLDTAGGFYWMPTTGAIYIGGLGAANVSRDGGTIVGVAADSRGVQAAIWQRSAEWRLLGSFGPGAVSCGTSLSSAADVSRDGKVVVGLGWNGCNLAHAFRWEDSTGMVDLGSSVALRSSRADAVSADGKVVVGHQEDATGFTRGAQWVEGRQELFTGPSVLVGTAKAANYDGSIVVGRICDPYATPGQPTFQSAWIWTRADGVKCLPPPGLRGTSGPTIIVEAAALSDDGRVIGGRQGVAASDDANAVIWIDRTPFYLKDYLRAHGVPDAFETWVNTGSITDISPDGRVIVGKGAARAGFRGYIIILGDKP